VIHRIAATILAAFALGAAPMAAAQSFDNVQIVTESVGPGVYMLTGQGGNLGLLVGQDGAVLIDDQFAPLTEKITAAVAKVSEKPVRFVINTHWHGDHTGGNENLGKAGAVIVAHGKVRERMSTEQVQALFNRTVPASPPAALPVVTFETGLTLHLNGNTLDVFHVEPAHTDGDSIIHFVEANAFHMGDTYVNGAYPIIDISSGGRLEGMIAAHDRILAMAKPDTKIMPGHGKLSNVAELRETRDMLVTVRDRVKTAIAAGKSADTLVAEKPLADLDEKWGKGFMNSERLVRILHADLSR
jgi:glyoxylase-like metal-dependent hydrolase (beta-lactamase superfamily II)